MVRIKYDIDAMKFMSLFSSIARARLKDCIISDNHVIFIVEENEIAKAIGKGAANVRKLETIMKKKVKMVEFSSDIVKFVQNLTYPAKIKEALQEDRILKLKAADSQSRGLLIGRGASILRAYEAIVKRYFDIDEIKVE